jgi:hypothetical protein
VLDNALVPIALSLALAATGPALAQPGLPSGGDQVLLGRVFHRGPAGTVAVQRFGIVVGKSGSSRLRVEVPRRADDPATGYALEISAERRRGAVRLDWALLPAGAESVVASRGSQEVLSGVLGHVSIAEAGDTRIYASVEHGRASSFDALKLARHFGVDLGGGPAPRAPARSAPAAPAMPAPVRAAAAPPAAASAVTGGILNLSFVLQQDGETSFAPRVRVRGGQAFAVKGGQAVEAAGERWDGFELSGVARLQGGSCYLDLAIQSGRRLDDGGTATWLVDRYRRDVAVALGVASELALFEDLEGAGAGDLRLQLTCERE